MPDRNIFSVALRLDKSRVLHDLGLDEFVAATDPTWEEIRTEESVGQSADSMRQLALAMQNHLSTRRAFPAARARGLSWRVAILPYIEQGDLYREFRLDEPWDSEHNLRLVARMPEIFASSNPELKAAGKTRFVVPRGAGTVFANPERGLGLQHIADGSSNTALVLEADDAHAVIWTKPDDLELVPDAAERPLALHPPGASFIALCDGSTVFVRRELPAAELAALLSIAGGEPSNWQQFAATPPLGGRRGVRPSDSEAAMLAELRLGELITRGVGNQVGFHAYDCTPMFDLSLPQLLGGLVGSLRGSQLDDFVYIAPLVGSLNGPVYLSIPVQDRRIVDDFLDRLDRLAVELARQDQGGGFFSMQQDFYRLEAEGDLKVRTYVLRIGPLKWRFFWSRIGDGLYIASKREVLDDLAKADAARAAARASAEAGPAATASDVGHGLVRLRPEHWNQVLDTYRLGWEENARVACLQNTGPLASLNRALVASEATAPAGALEELHEYAARVYDVHHVCPDGGHYRAAAHGAGVECSVHGTAAAPRQGAAPGGQSPLGRELAALRDICITLTFLEDGLHAVATIERSP